MQARNTFLCYTFYMGKINKFIEYLQDKYGPVSAILLHGSRASGYAREHSDWDFIILTDHQVDQKQYRDFVENENIEFEVFQLPVAKENIVRVFNTKLKHAQAVYDPKGVGQDLIDQAREVYEEGIPEEWITGTSLVSKNSYLQSAIDGMKDNLDNPAMFMKKLGTFYPRIINIWYQIKERAYSDNIYISIPHIQELDPVFADKLEVVYSLESSPREKIKAAESLMGDLF